nr:hypothetical protein [Marinilongibacter aquaticus]
MSRFFFQSFLFGNELLVKLAFFRRLLLSQIRESKIKVTNIDHRIVIFTIHGQTLRWTNRCAKSAKATLGHVDIELGGIKTHSRAVGSMSNDLRRLYRLDIDTVDGTNLGTFVAHNTIVDFTIELVSTVVGYRNALVRVLNGYRAFIQRKVAFLSDILSGTRNTSLHKVLPSQLHALCRRPDPSFYIAEI